jgi:sec-independent protein translocase protein TatA
MFAWSFSAPEIIALLVLAVLLFGKKLPEVAASMGKSVRVFQNSWNGIEEETVASISQATAPVRQAAVPQRIGTAGPKFDELAAAPEPPPVM